MTTKIFFVLKMLGLSLPLFLGLSFVYAWTAPTATPPSSNVSAPINVSGVDQTKLGDICTTKGGALRCISTSGVPSATVIGQTLRWNGTSWGVSSEGDVYANGITVGRGGGNVFSNTANGFSALLSNTTGNANTANGSSALYSNTTGNHNTANGALALYSNTTGYSNVANGYLSLYFNTTGISNTASGAFTLSSNTTGNHNTANGYLSLYSNTTGGSNVASGVSSLYSNTTGSNNSANGYLSLSSNTTGSNNVASGVSALSANTVGFINTANGYLSLSSNTTGNYNTANGASALSSNTTGSYNTALGNTADVSIGNLTNATAIGNGAIADASNKVRIGNAAVTVIGGPVAWSNLSDIRAKEDIVDYTHGLDLITKLRPVEYKLKADSTKKIHSGFIAQEVEATGIPFYGLNKPESKEGYYSLSYAEFVVPLVNSVKELKIENDKVKADHNDLRARIENLEKKILSL